MNGTLYFSACEPTSGCELWKSDGTSDGTVLVKDINPGPEASEPDIPPLSVNGALLFGAFEPSTGAELWKTDGTPQGTVLFKDINPGPASGRAVVLATIGGTLLFRADDGTSGLELWKTDGTPEGTVLLKDINPGPGDSLPQSVVSIDGTFFFSAFEPTTGRELWKTDGTPEGTVLVKDSNPGPGDSVVTRGGRGHGVAGNGRIFFGAFEPTTGRELWTSDGTPEGTVLVADINPGPSDSDPRMFRIINGALFFSAFEPMTGIEPWILGSLSRRGNGTLEPGEECDDGNVSDGDCCSSACRFEPSGTPCPDDGNLCTADQCDGAGTCAHPAGLTRGCQPALSEEASLLLKDRKSGAKDRLEWTWTSSTATPKEDFGTPTTTSNYTLCVYGTEAGEPILELSATAPAGGACGTQPCWKERRRAFTYGGDKLTHDGLHSLLLRSGKQAGKGKIFVEGKGSTLRMPTLPLHTPITVQLKRSDGTSCWEATYSKARVSRAGLFKATSD